MEKSTFTPLYEAFRRRLVEMRKKAGLTQRQLAARLKREPSFVARIEQGERRLDVVEFYWVCAACEADPAGTCGDVMREFKAIERSRTRISKAKSRRSSR
jgi:transcriptional regulator with XRE-family HTH domain